MNQGIRFFILLFFPIMAFGQSGNLVFIENKGQYPETVRYAANIPGGKVYFQDDQIIYAFYDAREVARRHEATHHEHARISSGMLDLSDINMHAVKVRFGEKSIPARPIGKKSIRTHYNYFHGEKTGTDCRGFSELTYTNVFEGTDIRFYSEKGALKYDLELSKGADIEAISFLYEGAEGISLQNNHLEVKTSVNRITEYQPYAYQEIAGNKSTVGCNYKLKGNRLSFEVKDNYDRKNKLVIDPLLIFSTYSGSTSDNWGFTAAFDQEGNLYSGGIVFGPGFPATSGSFRGGVIDVGVLKYDSTGSDLIYATYIGGNNGEAPHSLIVNEDNELIILGTTSSSNFPTTLLAYQQGFAGGNGFSENGMPYTNGSDIFITVLNAAGNIIKASTFLGGTSNDGVGRTGFALLKNYGDQYRGDINVDPDGNIYVASNTSSNDFPIENGFQPTFGGGDNDGVVFKFNENLSDLLWSSYIGGSNEDAAYSIKFDTTGNVFIAGGTNSINFPATAGALNENIQGDIDGFVAKIEPDGNAIISCSYLGTSGYDQAYFVDLDTGNSVYVLGQTAGVYPVSDDVYSNPNSGQFIHKLTNGLDSTLLSTVFGSGDGDPDISPTAFLVNECGNLYISGWGSPQLNFQPPSGNTTGLPVTEDAFQSTTDGSDFYLMVLQRNFGSLLHGTFFGGAGPVSEHVDGGTSRFDKRGIVYHAVCADCGGGGSQFPSTPGAWSETNNSANCNNAAFKFDLSSLRARLETNSPQFDRPGITIGCRPFEVALINRTIGGIEYFWDYGNGDGSTNTVLDTVLVTYEDIGEYTVVLRAVDENTCKAVDVATTVIKVFEPEFTVSPDVTICEGEETLLEVTGGISHVWHLLDSTVVGNGNRLVVSPDTTTAYVVNVFDLNGCELRDTLNVEVIPSVSLGFDFEIRPGCDNKAEIIVNNFSEGSEEYLWIFEGTDTVNAISPTHTYLDSGVYQVTLRVENDNRGCTPPVIREVNLPKLFVPNVFTPGSPPLNETFQVVTPHPIDLVVFNRWGRTVFEQKNYQNSWDGSDVAGGVYYYEITFRNGGNKCNGWVQLMR